MVGLAEQKRQQYKTRAPTFYRPAPNASEIHRPWIAKLVADEDVATLVHDNGQGGIDAFIIANLVPAPPVYVELTRFGGHSVSEDHAARSTPLSARLVS